MKRLPSEYSRNAVWSVIEFTIAAFTTWAVYRAAISIIGLPELGRWATATAFVVFFRAFDVGAAPSITRDIALAVKAGDRDNVFRIACTGLIITVAFSTLVGLVGSAAIFMIARFSGDSAVRSVQDLLPFAYGAYFLLSLSAALGAAVGGLGLWHMKSRFNAVAVLLQLATALALFRSVGAAAIGIGQIVQYSTVSLALWIACLRHFGQPLTTNPVAYFSRTDARSILALAAKVQVTNLAGFVFDPLVRLALASYSSFSAAGAYDVALKVILQFKAAIQIVVQTASHRFAGLGRVCAQQEEARLYSRVLLAVIVMVLAFEAVMYFEGSSIIKVVFNEDDPRVSTFIWIAGAGYGMNIVAMPSYFFAVGRSYVRWNLAGHLAMLLSFVLLTGIGAHLIGSTDVVVNASLAVFLGSATMWLGNSLAFRLSPTFQTSYVNGPK